MAAVKSSSQARTDRATILERYRRSARWKPLEYAFWCVPVLAYFVFAGNYLLLTEIVITGLFALSLDLIFGYAGIISLGHAAFFGTGAYVVGLMGVYGFGQPLLGLLCAALAAALIGFLSSFLLLRGNDLSRLMVTLGVALMLKALVNKFADITGGSDGLQGIVIQPILGLFDFDLFGKTGFVYSALVLFIMFWLARRLVHSSYGQSLRGINQNALRMPALGVDVNWRLIIIYTIGAAFAGVAGALYTQTTQFVSLDVLSFGRSADVLLIIILGGGGYLYGGIVGAVIYTLMAYFLSDINQQYWIFWVGLLLIVIVMFARGGVLGTAEKWLESRRRRKATRSSGGESS